MKKALYIAALLSLAGSSAHAQAGSPTQIVFAAIAADGPEVAAVTAAVHKELERSRQLEPLYVQDDSKPQLTVPLALTKDAAGNMTVKYELRTAKRYKEEPEVSCPVAKPENCGRDIVIAAEKFIRKNNKDR